MSTVLNRYVNSKYELAKQDTYQALQIAKQQDTDDPESMLEASQLFAMNLAKFKAVSSIKGNELLAHFKIVGGVLSEFR